MVDLKKLQFYVSIASSVALLLFGLLLLGLCISGLIRTLDKNSWPQTSAVIERSEIVSKLTRNTGSTRHAIPREWRLQVEYRFEVEGQSFLGKRLGSFHSEPSERSDADQSEAPEALQDLQSQYDEGNRLNIFYNPDNPEDSFIRKESANAMPWVMAILGLICVVAASFRIRKLAREGIKP